MIGRSLLALAMLALLAGPAFASQCPADIAKIDAALAANPGMLAAQRKPVVTLRDMGERLHKAGKHTEAVESLGHAKEMLRQMGVAVD